MVLLICRSCCAQAEEEEFLRGPVPAEDEHHFVFDCILFNQGQVYCHFLGTSPYLVFFLHFT